MKICLKVLLFTILLVPCYSYAMTGSGQIYFNCVNQLNNCSDNSCNNQTLLATDGEEIIKCTFNYNVRDMPESLDLSYTISDNIEFVGYEAYEDIVAFTHYSSGNNEQIQVSLKNQNIEFFSQKAVILKYRITTSQVNKQLFFKDFSTNSITGIEEHAKPVLPSDIYFTTPQCGNGLTNIKINNIDVFPNFDIDKTEYNLTTSEQIINIIGVKQCERNQIKGIGNYSLKKGENKINLSVTSPYGISKTYKLNITYVPIESSINTFEKILINDKLINFNSDNVFSIDVDSNVNNLNLKYVLSDIKSTITIDGNKDFKSGKNVVLITIEAENGDKNAYVINVNKALSNNSNLSNLEIKAGSEILALTPSFEKSNLEYMVNVNESIKEISVNAEALDSKAIINGNGKINIEDKSESQIIVMAEDGTRTIYTIKINKIVENIIDEKEKTSENKKEENRVIDSNNKFNYINLVVIVVSLIIVGYVLYIIIKRKKYKNL